MEKVRSTDETGYLFSSGDSTIYTNRHAVVRIRTTPALAAAPIDSMETAVSVCVYTQHTTLPQRLVRLVFTHPPLPFSMTRYIAFGFQLPLPWRTDPPNFAAIRLRLLTLLRLGVAPVSVFLVYLAAPGPCQRRRSLEFSGSIPDSDSVHSGSSAG